MLAFSLLSAQYTSSVMPGRHAKQAHFSSHACMIAHLRALTEHCGTVSVVSLLNVSVTQKSHLLLP